MGGGTKSLLGAAIGAAAIYFTAGAAAPAVGTYFGTAATAGIQAGAAAGSAASWGSIFSGAATGLSIGAGLDQADQQAAWAKNAYGFDQNSWQKSFDWNQKSFWANYNLQQKSLDAQIASDNAKTGLGYAQIGSSDWQFSGSLAEKQRQFNFAGQAGIAEGVTKFGQYQDARGRNVAARKRYLQEGEPYKVAQRAALARGATAMEALDAYTSGEKSITESAAYAWRRNKALGALEASARSRGEERSGAYDKAVMLEAGNLAAQERGRVLGEYSGLVNQYKDIAFAQSPIKEPYYLPEPQGGLSPGAAAGLSRSLTRNPGRSGGSSRAGAGAGGKKKKQSGSTIGQWLAENKNGVIPEGWDPRSKLPKKGMSTAEVENFFGIQQGTTSFKPRGPSGSGGVGVTGVHA